MTNICKKIRLNLTVHIIYLIVTVKLRCLPFAFAIFSCDKLNLFVIVRENVDSLYGF